MNIKITQTYKYIPAPLEFQLPRLCILTGENGCGKTHILNALYGSDTCEITNNDKLIENIVLVPFGKLNPEIVESSCDSAIYTQKTKYYWSMFSEDNPQFQEGIQRVLYVSGLNKEAISEDVFSKYVAYMDGPVENRVFSSQFAMIFKGYHIKYIDNLLLKMYEEMGITTEGRYLDDSEFKAEYGEEPWIFVNKILQKLHLPYEVNNPMGTKREDRFLLKLKNIYSDYEIDIEDLSTGEKILMSIAIALYNDIAQGNKIELMLLDEPDAGLHPSMIKIMLDIIEHDIVERYNVSVILTTHSPVTLALAPAKSLFKITREDKKPVQCDLEDSTKLLSYGIHNFRVSIDDRRQVFVENSFDAIYYEKLYSIMSRYHKFQSYPQFLPPHKLNGSNCNDVIDIVNALCNLGNTQVYGLIDWDRKNKSDGKIIVLGAEKRYSIENYIFEPHLLGLYLIKKCFIQPLDVGLEEFHSYMDICKVLSPDILQILVRSIESKLFAVSKPSKKEQSTLNNGWVIEVNSELFQQKGHDLEENCKNVWPQLKSISRGSDFNLKNDIINTIANDLPELFSRDLVDTFHKFL